MSYTQNFIWELRKF